MYGNRIDLMNVILSKKTQFFEGLEEIVNNYEVKDNVFGWQDDKCQEIKEGFYAELEELEDLSDAFAKFDINESLIRVADGKFYLGRWSKLEEINDGLVINLKKKLVCN